jgi:hypothetical protein
MGTIVAHMCRIPGSGGCWHESELRYGHRRGMAVLGAAPTSAAAFDKTGAAEGTVAKPIMITPAIAIATEYFIIAFVIVVSFECARSFELRNSADRRFAAAVSLFAGALGWMQPETSLSLLRESHSAFSASNRCHLEVS